MVASNLDLRVPNKRAVKTIALRVGEHEASGSDGVFEGVIDAAVGMGKTYIMAAAMDYFAAGDGIRNFAIITPGSTILQKTKSNFTPESSEEPIAGPRSTPGGHHVRELQHAGDEGRDGRPGGRQALHLHGAVFAQADDEGGPTHSQVPRRTRTGFLRAVERPGRPHGLRRRASCVRCPEVLGCGAGLVAARLDRPHRHADQEDETPDHLPVSLGCGDRRGVCEDACNRGPQRRS